MSGQLILGKDVANNNYVPISVDSSGHLDIDVQVADLDSKCMVSVDGTTSGTQKQARCDTDGHLQVDILSGGGGDATAANQTTQITNQGTINTSIGTVNTSVGTVNSTLGDTNSKIDAMRGTSDLGVINTSLGTVNTSIGTSNSTLTDIEAHQGNIENNLSSIQSTVSSNKLQVDVITTALPTGAATQATLADVEAHQGNIENNLSSIQSTVSSNKLQVDVITSALPSGAATETTLAAAEVHLGAIDTSCSSIQSNVSTSSNQGTMITSLASLAGCVSGNELQVDIVAGGGGGGGDASAANQTTMITHLSEIEGAVETIETCVSGTELQVDVITSALPSGAATETTLAAAEAHIGTIDTSTASVAGCVAGTELQVDVITSALPTGAATETTLAAAEAHIGTIDTSTASVAGCVSGTEVQVDVRNRTDASPVALTFSVGNKIIAASGITTTAAIDVGGCSKYSIMLNMLTATANAADLLSCKVIIEYSPDDGSTFMGTVSASGGGAPESIVPAALYEPTGGSASTIVGYGAYVVPTLNMTAPTAGTARTNKIRVKVQNNSSNALTLDKFAIYKFN